MLLLSPLLLLLSGSPLHAIEPQVTDLVIARADGPHPLRVDIYLPPGPGPHPCLLYAFGGGWEAGDKSTARLESAYLVPRGYAVVAVAYRRTGESPFPAAVEDMTIAVRWVRENGGANALDPARVGLWGNSAGGNIVGLVGLAWDDPLFNPDGVTTSARPDAIVMVAPPVNLRDLPPQFTVARDLAANWLGCPSVDDCPDSAWLGSPRAYIRADAPPILILHGDADNIVPAPATVEFHNALLAVGATSNLQLLPGVDHSLTYDLPLFEQNVFPFLEANFASPSPIRDGWMVE